ncbi:hypothetical protein J6590_026192 [Homalodisca vitripennis]|nr:hypothetical protein J6590_026192 [Homalodisca vitripennis]
MHNEISIQVQRKISFNGHCGYRTIHRCVAERMEYEGRVFPNYRYPKSRGHQVGGDVCTTQKQRFASSPPRVGTYHGTSIVLIMVL